MLAYQIHAYKNNKPNFVVEKIKKSYNMGKKLQYAHAIREEKTIIHAYFYKIENDG